jgi:hypothetical protein
MKAAWRKFTDTLAGSPTDSTLASQICSIVRRLARESGTPLNDFELRRQLLYPLEAAARQATRRIRRPVKCGRMTPEQRRKLASRLAVVMFSLIWEGDYSPQSAPGEDELYDALLGALDRFDWGAL